MRLARRTRLAGLGVALAASLVLTACGGGSDSGSDSPITTFGTNPENPLIPTSTNEVGGGNVLDVIFAGLVTYDSDGTAVNDVASSIEPNDDSTVWTAKLKKTTFSDGTPVTADSFVKAWNYGADPANKQLNASFFSPLQGTKDDGTLVDGADSISGLEAEGDDTLVMTLKEPESDFNLRLGYTAYMPLPDSAFGADGKITKAFGDKPIGNGTYQLTDTGWEKNKQIALEPNPEYKGPHKAQNNGVVFTFYTSPEAGYTDVQAGNLDINDQVPPSALQNLENDSSIKAYNEVGSLNDTLTIPKRLKHFGGEEGKLRRQALSKAIDRKAITEKIFYGARTPMKDFTGVTIQGWTADIPGNDVLDTDVAEAKRLWAQADDISPWSGTFTIAYNNDGGGNQQYTEAVANQVSSAFGIKATNKSYAGFDELRTVINDQSIQTPFRSGWQADYPSMLNYLIPLYVTGSSSNDAKYDNPEFNQLIADASAATAKERFADITKAQSILMEDLPAIPLWYRNSTAATNPDLKGFEFNWKGKPELYKITK